MLPLIDLGSVSRYAARVLAARPELGKPSSMRPQPVRAR